MQETFKINQFIHSLEASFNEVKDFKEEFKIEVDSNNNYPFISIRNTYFIFFDIENHELIISFEKIVHENDSVEIIKQFNLEERFNALNFIIDYYINGKIKSVMEREYFDYEKHI
jgi:hypothetical protein